ncbi:hypothetical protein CPAR01_10188 [Colletotrichum paranaense]|uniref:Secreted protein n=1 Tax=Colletotrichum paranaense TaxID=1914294 RepID=A0ABQ9SDY5_9PEZI|nr:uncharacterized protein CPAR01_10188 [Colletotrichum paranaense]KAK1533480.1 hypothetical protein CPAR01_10188 [Colletotrichum paranaense]
MCSLYRVAAKAVPWLWCSFLFTSGECRVCANHSIGTTRAVHFAFRILHDTLLLPRGHCDLRTSEGTSPAGLRSSRDGDA